MQQDQLRTTSTAWSATRHRLLRASTAQERDCGVASVPHERLWVCELSVRHPLCEDSSGLISCKSSIQSDGSSKLGHGAVYRSNPKFDYQHNLCFLSANSIFLISILAMIQLLSHRVTSFTGMLVGRRHMVPHHVLPTLEGNCSVKISCREPLKAGSRSNAWP